MARAAHDVVPVVPTDAKSAKPRGKQGSGATSRAPARPAGSAEAIAARTASAFAEAAALRGRAEEAATAAMGALRFTGEGTRGLTFERRWTRVGVHPYDEIAWETRTAAIGNESGKLVFEQKDVEVPASWSQLATNVVVSKYFRGHLGTPERETSVRQLIDRVVLTIAAWAETQHYFATPEDLATFTAELTYLLVHQKMSFNSPVWFNVGIEARPQCSACFINSVQDSMTSIMDLAKTEAMLFKFGSGAGSNLSTIRSSREKMAGGGTASGPVSFMKGYDAFAGVVKCVMADTYISTGGGLLRIDEAIQAAGPVGFVEDDSLTLNTPVGPTRISHVYRSPLADVRRVELRTGLGLTGTLDHPVLTLGSGLQLRWTPLADLRPGDRVAVERRRELWPTRAPALDLFDSDVVAERLPLRYPAETTPALARLLGYLVAEGSVEEERFGFSSADPEVMADYCRVVGAVFGVDPSDQVRGRINATTGVRTESVSLSWKGALQFLAYCGLPAGRSADKSVPLAIRRSPRSLVLEFLGAYAEGDAHLGTSRIEVSTASSRLAEEIQLLALNLGVVGRRSTINGYQRLAFLGAEAAHLARVLRPYLVTPRKREAAAALVAAPAKDRNPNLDTIPGLVPALRSLLAGPNGWVRATSGELMQTRFGVANQSSDNVSYARTREIPDLVGQVTRLSPSLGDAIEHVLEDEYLWDEVVAVTDAGQALTYDFTVPGVHAFVSNGIVSHNSGGKTRRAAKMVILDVGHPDILDFVDSKKLEEQKAWALIEQGYDASFTGEAYGSVAFQNANHSVRVTDDFMRAVETDGDWTTHAVVGGAPMDTHRARDIFRRMAEAAHVCGDPGIQYDTTINDWNPVANSDRQYATNPCSEYSFLNDTSCFAPETRISTPRGLRTVEELYNAQERGEQVLVTTDIYGENDHRRLTAHRTATVTRVGEREVFRMALRDGRVIRTTGDHRFLTDAGEWRRVDELTPGLDRIEIRESGNPVTFASSAEDTRRWRMLGWLTGDGVFSKDIAALVFGPHERATAEVMTEELTRLLVEARSSEETVEAVERRIGPGTILTNEGAMTAVSPKERVSLGTRANGVLQVSSKTAALIRMLEDRYGMSQGTAIHKDVPAEVHRVADDLKVAYLQGLFSADGSIWTADAATEPQVMLASSAPALLRSVQLLLADLGITSRATWTHPEGRANPQGQLHIYNQAARTFMSLIGFPASPAKQAKVDTALARPFAGARKNPRATAVESIAADGVEIVYDITEPTTHSLIAEGLIAHNCNLASLNLMTFVGEDGELDVDAFRYGCRLTITAQEVLVDNASYPTPKIEENSHRFRPLGLGYANLGALLMSRGLAYDSPDGQAYAAAITSIMTAEAYRQSAVIARDHGGPFIEFEKNRAPFMAVIEKHREAARGLPTEGVPANLATAARSLWDETSALGEAHGYRNAQTTLLAPTGCLVGDSLVLTDRGLVRLRGLGNPDGEKWQDLDIRVATDDGPREATRFYVNGAEPIVTVETARGYRIQGTTTHRIRVVDASGDWQWRRFADLRAGDRVPMMLGGMIGEPREVPLPPLPEAHWTSDHRTFVPRYLNADLAELVGYFMGDGSLHARGLRFCVTAGDDDVVARIAELGRRLFGLEAAVTPKTGYTEVALQSVRLTLWWEACGFAKHAPNGEHRGKGYEAHVPDAVLYSNDATVYRAFIRGLFEADGTVNNGYASWSTVSDRFSREVQTLLLALGFATTRKVDQPTRGHRGANPIHVLRLLNASAGGRFLAEISFMSERKRTALALADHPQATRYDLVPVSRQTVDRLAPDNDHLRKTMLLSLSRTGLVSRRSASALLERTADPDLAQALGYFYDEIASATLGEEQLTYDLSVPANVTYVANGFVSHNTIAFMMDCDTTGIEPDIALIKYKKLVGEGYLKIVNNTVPGALRQLGYSPTQVEEIVAFVDERETIEGAPGLLPEHLPVFDCAFKPRNGVRSIQPMGHVRMMAAVQPFLSGAISKTVNMPEAATVEEIEQIYLEGWRLGLKAIAIYRDNSKRSQPLSTSKLKSDDETKAASEDLAELRRQLAVAQAEALKPHRRRLPAERAAVTHKFEISGHEGYITVGLYPDGQPGEIFLKMAKEGSTVSGLMDTFATAISLALQYGVPLRDLVNKFAHVRFEPSGFTGNSEIPIAKSSVDYIFRWLGSRFLVGDDRAALGIQDRGGTVVASPFSFGAAALAPQPEEGPSAIDEALEPPKATTTAVATATAQGSSPAPGAAGSAARAAASAKLDLPVIEPATNGHAGNGRSTATSALAASLGAERTAFKIQEDAPSCADCGSIMVRNGSCYKCLNCGATSGCS